MTTPTFTPPTTAPNRNQGESVFNTNMAAFLSWLVTWAGEVTVGVGWIADQVTAIVAYVAAAASSALSAAASATAALGASGYMRRSSATLSIGAGVKAVTGLNSPSNASFANTDEILLVDATNRDNRMWGAASNVNAGAGTMDVTVAAGAFTGSGSPTSWIVSHRAFETLVAATPAEIRAGVTGAKAFTPDGLYDALDDVALADAATVTPDMTAGSNFTWTIGGNRTLGALTNARKGMTGRITITQDGTGGRVLAGASGVYKRDGGFPVLPTAAGAKAHLRYEVLAVDGSNVATEVELTFSKPT
jgi:hypothetical protein